MNLKNRSFISGVKNIMTIMFIIDIGFVKHDLVLIYVIQPKKSLVKISRS